MLCLFWLPRHRCLSSRLKSPYDFNEFFEVSPITSRILDNKFVYSAFRSYERQECIFFKACEFNRNYAFKCASIPEIRLILITACSDQRNGINLRVIERERARARHSKVACVNVARDDRRSRFNSRPRAAWHGRAPRPRRRGRAAVRSITRSRPLNHADISLFPPGVHRKYRSGARYSKFRGVASTLFGLKMERGCAFEKGARPLTKRQALRNALVNA